MSSTSYLKALYDFFKNNEQNELTITVCTPDADRDAKIIEDLNEKPNLKFDLKKGNKPSWFDGDMNKFIEENIKPNIDSEELKNLVIEQLELQKGMIENLTTEEMNEIEKHDPISYKYLNNKLNQEEENNYVNNQVEKAIDNILSSQIQTYQRLIDDEIEKGNSTKGFFISLNIENPMKYKFYCQKTIEHIKNSPDKDNIQLLFFINTTDYRFEITSENGDIFITDDFDENYSVNESI